MYEIFAGPLKFRCSQKGDQSKIAKNLVSAGKAGCLNHTKMSRRMSNLAREMIAPNVIPVLDLPGNNRCCDCNTHSPDWCSLSFGTIICLDCAGHHRSLGIM
jgi:hypothetical protein